MGTSVSSCCSTEGVYTYISDSHCLLCYGGLSDVLRNLTKLIIAMLQSMDGCKIFLKIGSLPCHKQIFLLQKETV